MPEDRPGGVQGTWQSALYGATSPGVLERRGRRIGSDFDRVRPRLRGPQAWKDFCWRLRQRRGRRTPYAPTGGFRRQGRGTCGCSRAGRVRVSLTRSCPICLSAGRRAATTPGNCGAHCASGATPGPAPWSRPGWPASAALIRVLCCRMPRRAVVARPRPHVHQPRRGPCPPVRGLGFCSLMKRPLFRTTNASSRAYWQVTITWLQRAAWRSRFGRCSVSEMGRTLTRGWPRQPPVPWLLSKPSPPDSNRTAKPLRPRSR